MEAHLRSQRLGDEAVPVLTLLVNMTQVCQVDLPLPPGPLPGLTWPLSRTLAGRPAAASVRTTWKLLPEASSTIRSPAVVCFCA
jgi:hypothetical protein